MRTPHQLRLRGRAMFFATIAMTIVLGLLAISDRLVRRMAVGDESGTMMLSLTEQAHKHLAELASQQSKS